MTTTITTDPSLSQLSTNKHNCDQPNRPLIFDATVLKHQLNVPSQFVWPDHERPSADPPELDVPLVDLRGFLSGDPSAASRASLLVGEACRKHGFFLVVNHGVDADLITQAHRYMDHFFEQPLHEKQRALRKLGEHCGYASSFTGRFSSKLPWKETLSFQYNPSSHIVEHYFRTTLGNDFAHLGYVKKLYITYMYIFLLSHIIYIILKYISMIAGNFTKTTAMQWAISL